jgi:hypothetical protein
LHIRASVARPASRPELASSGGSGTSVQVDLLGLKVTTSNIQATLTAETGQGLLLVSNVANLLDPGNSFTLLSLLPQLDSLGL